MSVYAYIITLGVLAAAASAQGIGEPFELSCASISCSANPTEEMAVCGTDGVTYVDACDAVCNGGVQPAHSGACAGSDLECAEFCPEYYEPLCGTDGVTYSNVCFLDQAACRQRTEIGIRFLGECVVNADSVEEICAAISCVDNPTEESAVCGPDGVTYVDVCDAVCNGGVLPTHPGPCEPECTEFCPEYYQPLCGTDGVTYSNVCFLSQAACLQRTEIGIQNEGPCEASVQPTEASCGGPDDEECPPDQMCFVSEGVCVPDPNTSINCEVVRCSTTDYTPVCDVDGVTRLNPCVARCVDGVEIAYFGECSDEEEEEEECEPRPCPAFGTPVCGTDGVSYPSRCYLEQAKCRNPDLDVLAEGHCIPCGGILGLPCPEFSVCTDDPKCNITLITDCPGRCAPQQCDFLCPLIFRPVCGSDGVTYSNDCEFQRADCERRGALEKVHDGPCRPAPEPTLPVCPFRCPPNTVCSFSDEKCNVTSALPCPRPECKSICELPIDTGRCKASGRGRVSRRLPYPRWGFDAEANDCVEFLWHGCSSNGNHFATERECDQVCEAVPEETRPDELPQCEQAPFYQGDGPYICYAVIPSWSFNPVSGECEFWNYGGCGANDNIFDTLEECARTCAAGDRA